VISYQTLRKALGWIGITLPFVIVLGQLWLFHGPMKGSLSAYYHTGMRNWFVGALCAMAAFLASYRGYDAVDEWVTNVAGLAALGVAFFHTAPDVGATDADRWIGRVHVGCAAVLFVGLAVMAILFARTTTPSARLAPLTVEVKRAIFRGCGGGIVLCLVAMVVLGPIGSVAQYRPVLWLESAAIVLFGVSWLVKGLTGAPQQRPGTASQAMLSA
jgi:hypothetical protein